MSTLPTPHARFSDELGDRSHGENQSRKTLPKMATAAAPPELKAGCTAPFPQTRDQVGRLIEGMKLLGVPAKGKVCHAMVGLVEAGAEATATQGPTAVRDAALIGAAQRAEHHGMAGYGTAPALDAGAMIRATRVLMIYK